MELIQAISSQIVPVIVLMAAAWFLVFLVTYVLGRRSHAELTENLLELRDSMELPATASESEVLVRLRQALSSSHDKVKHQAELLFKQANKRVSEDRVRLCEQLWSSLRALLEVFPILGILGTVCAMALAADSKGSAEEASNRLAAVMGNFGDAMYSTIWGLGSAAVGMILLGVFAPRVEQWFEDIREFKTLVHKAEHIHRTEGA